MAKDKKPKKKTRKRTNYRTQNRTTRRRNGCDLTSVLSSLKTFIYEKLYSQAKSKSKSKSKSPTIKPIFPYHIVLITTHGQDICSPDAESRKVSIPRSFQGGHIIRTGHLGSDNYCSSDFANKIKNAIRIIVKQNENMDESDISPELFRTTVRETDNDNDRKNDFTKPYSDYPIYEIDENLPERYYSFSNNELSNDKDNFDYSITLLSGKKSDFDLMEAITEKSKSEMIKEYNTTRTRSKTNIIKTTTFTLSKVLRVLKKKDPLKKVIIIDYGCSGEHTDRGSRWMTRHFLQYKRIPKMTVVN